MLEFVTSVLAGCAATGAGLIAGVFFAFSSFVMRALSRLPADHGVAAMQAINIAVIEPRFLSVFVGTGVCCAASIVVAVARWDTAVSCMTIVGAVLYLAGTFWVTVRRNVPLNDALAMLQPDNPRHVSEWERYVRSWTRWNHTRTVAALLAMVAFLFAMTR